MEYIKNININGVDINIIRDNEAVALRTELEVNGLEVSISFYGDYIEEDAQLTDYWGEDIEGLLDYGIGTTIEVSFCVGGKLTYQEDAIKGNRVAITRALRKMYASLLVALYGEKQGNVLLHCVAHSEDGYGNYRKAIYKKMGYTLWQDADNADNHYLYNIL